jgi:glycosyltransferase involved in cell wall biosynthesis
MAEDLITMVDKETRQNLPKVTVIMTTYNSESYLRMALDSLLNQRFSDFEVVIVDDNSQDATIPIIDSYCDNRIVLINNSKKRGIGYARKIALENARGEYIAILDSDDIAYKDRLQVQVTFLNEHPDIHLIGSAYEIIDEVGNLKHTARVRAEPLINRWLLLFQDCIANSTAMFRKEFALEVGGYDEQLCTGEDFDLWIRFAAFGRIAQLDLPLIQHREHRLSLQSIESAKTKATAAKIIIKSIRLQTGRNVTLNAAKCFLEDYLKDNPGGDAVKEALFTIMNCLRFFESSFGMSQAENEQIKLLAAEGLLRVAFQRQYNIYIKLLAMSLVAKINYLYLVKRIIKFILKP